MLAQQLTQTCGNRGKRERRVWLTFLGPAQMGHQHHRRPLGMSLLYRWECGPESRIAGDNTVPHWHIQVLANEDALIFEGEVRH